jgi:hypothetical protein
LMSPSFINAAAEAVLAMVEARIIKAESVAMLFNFMVLVLPGLSLVTGGVTAVVGSTTETRED